MAPRVDAAAPTETLRGVGPKIAERLARLGVTTVSDLVEHLPRGFLDWGEATSFRELAYGQEGTVRCEIERIGVRPTRRRNLKLVEASVKDGNGSRATAVWFNQAWLAESLTPGLTILIHGELEPRRGMPSFKVKRHEVADDSAGLHTLGLVPLYPASEEISTTKLLDLTEQALGKARWFTDPLPAVLCHEESLPSRADALRAAHRPRTRTDAEVGRRRLAFEELVQLITGLLRRRRTLESETTAPALGRPGDLVGRYRAVLPFTLTDAQEAAIREIDGDLATPIPMQRLLQGDVGSGKTVVALYALLRAAEQGRQGALMAPTETLAEQHFLTVESICNELGVRCELLTSSVPGKQHQAVRDRLASGEADLAVGTHALIQSEVDFRSLAVAVVDEQHRFGVEQRRALGAESPHVLHMTATPIPRTLAQSVYGDLDVTEIAQLPADRKPIVTRWIGHERSAEAYTRLRRHLADGRQAYVVCPLVTESAAIEARAAEEEAERLRSTELDGFRVGCLHGQLKPADRRGVMESFVNGKLDALVATTVIEVGVDVPNATIMIVQEADRFGLAQLHQLRGRVGRGAEQSYCLLVSRSREELTDSAQRRLQALVSIADGFELAEVDLELRGEGQLLGTRQSGLPDLKFVKLRQDRALIAAARKAALSLVEPSDITGPFDLEVERLMHDADHRGFA